MLVIHARPPPAAERAARSQLRAYRHGGFRPGEQVLQALAIGVVATAIDDFRSATGVYFVPLFFRCLYGSVWEVAFTVVCWLAAYVGAGQVWPRFAYGAPTISN